MSRLGRDYLQVGLLTEVTFPEYEVRFLAINDRVDSDVEDSSTFDFQAIKNLFNQAYAKECSEKIKAVKRAKGNAGEKMNANPPYGYLKDPANRKNWIVDEVAAKIIKRIFSDYMKGMSLTQIAKSLVNDEVLTPANHKKSIGVKIAGAKNNNPYWWSAELVGNILERQKYCGHTINFKTYKKSYKTKKRLPNSEDKMKISLHTHEAIIDQETFDLVQKMRKSTKRRKTKLGRIGLFSGIAHCLDCESRHYFFADNLYYRCSGFSSRRVQRSESHGTSELKLAEIVLDDFSRIAQLVVNHENNFVEDMQKQFELSNSKTLRQDKQALEKDQVRLSELDNIIQKLYEDNLSGKISDLRFMKLSEKYENEQAELKLFIDKSNLQLNKQTKQGKDISRFVNIVKKYFEPKELTHEMVRELIEKNELGTPKKVDGVRHQTVKIHCRFVDALAI